MYNDHLSNLLSECNIINHTTLATSIISSAKATLVDEKPPRQAWFELSKTSLMEAINLRDNTWSDFTRARSDYCRAESRAKLHLARK